jgi:hypothetical protein
MLDLLFSIPDFGWTEDLALKVRGHIDQNEYLSNSNYPLLLKLADFCVRSQYRHFLPNFFNLLTKSLNEARPILLDADPSLLFSFLNPFVQETEPQANPFCSRPHTNRFFSRRFPPRPLSPTAGAPARTLSAAARTRTASSAGTAPRDLLLQLRPHEPLPEAPPR